MMVGAQVFQVATLISPWMQYNKFNDAREKIKTVAFFVTTSQTGFENSHSALFLIHHVFEIP